MDRGNGRKHWDTYGLLHGAMNVARGMSERLQLGGMHIVDFHASGSSGVPFHHALEAK